MSRLPHPTLQLADGPERAAAKRARREEKAKLAPERARRAKLRRAEWRRRRGEPEAWEEEQDDVYDEDGLAWEWDERTALEAFQKGLVVPCVLNPDIRAAANGDTLFLVRWCLGDPGRDTWHPAAELEGTEALQQWRAEPGRMPTREECMGRAPWTERVRGLRAAARREREARWRARYDYLY